YFDNTHDGCNKFKKYNAMLNNFLNDMKWLRDQDTTPNALKTYLEALVKNKPSKATLKAEASLPRQKQVTSSKNVLNIKGNNNMFGNVQVGDVMSESESSSSSIRSNNDNGQKRKFNAGTKLQEVKNKRPA
ncbi:hypothetical protein K501DRAFT_163790, partial [Backusella circina FSU 941]